MPYVWLQQDSNPPSLEATGTRVSACGRQTEADEEWGAAYKALAEAPAALL